MESDGAELPEQHHASLAWGRDSVPEGPVSFESHADLTYRTLTGHSVDDVSLRQSLFTGSLLRECRFTRVEFSRSDLDGVRMEGCAFIDCDFATCDIRSAQFVRCEFERTNLDGTLISNSFFDGCRIADCSLSDAVQTNNTFLDTEWARTPISPGTTMHSRFERCRFEDMRLADCTFVFNVLSDCEFVGCEMNLESAGFVYGLKESDIRNLALIHLGRPYELPQGAASLAAVLDDYRARRWTLGETILGVSSRQMAPAFAAHRYFEVTMQRIVERGTVNADEITFLQVVFEEMDKEGTLPLISVLEALQWARAAGQLLSERNPSAKAGVSALYGFGTGVVSILHRQLDAFEDGREAIPNPLRDAPRRVSLTFREKPSMDLVALLTEAGRESGLPVAGETRLLHAGSGSYVEVVATTLLTVWSIQALLYLLNGCLIQVTELRSRAHVLRRPQLPSAYTELASRPHQTMPQPVLMALERLFSWLPGSGVLSRPDLGGLTAENVLRIHSSDEANRR